ncbi:hypothetical protein [Rhodoferax ferrireducens]|uniref:hypothetical protein n=1 Tax=Rhodoferax ferrireducens TaxID=192843 RepID=UPI000E0D709A|nr:hypothetical protein [Rhodoferax ferrireducens]
MRFFLLVVLLCGSPLLNGCSPTFNWREVRPAHAPLVALFPCKPDQGERVVKLGAKDLAMTMLACDSGGIKFALAHADLKDSAMTDAVLAQWKAATLANLQAQSVAEQPFVLKGANALSPPVLLVASGTRPDGSAVVLQAVWFAAGSVVFQAAMYGDTANPAVADAYFAGLRLQ